MGAESALRASLAPTLQGSNLVISDYLGNVALDRDALVIESDIVVCNGIIHVIDRVLIPD